MRFNVQPEPDNSSTPTFRSSRPVFVMQMYTRVVLLFASGVVVAAQGASPETISPVDLATDVAHAKQIIGSMVTGTYVVQGEKKFDNGYLVVEKLVFQPGARLTFIVSEGNHGDEFLIVTKELVPPPDGTEPAIITWEDPRPRNALLSPSGQGPSGKAGAEDADGAPGFRGGVGSGGASGRGSPTLTFLVNKVAGEHGQHS